MYIALPQKTKILTPGEGKTVSFLGEVLTFKATGEDTRGAWELIEFTGEAESGPLLHTHPWDEAFYVLEGLVEIQADSEVIMATPGCFVNIPGDTPHAFTVVSTSAKMLLLTASPAKASKYFKAIAPELNRLPTNMERTAAVSEKYDVHFL